MTVGAVNLEQSRWSGNSSYECSILRRRGEQRRDLGDERRQYGDYDSKYRFGDNGHEIGCSSICCRHNSAVTDVTRTPLSYTRAGEPFLRARAQTDSINFEGILSHAHRNFEGQNGVLEPSIIIIIDYCVINYNYIM
jgi:hypothetical protein